VLLVLVGTTTAGSWQGKEEERDHIRSVKISG